MQEDQDLSWIVNMVAHQNLNEVRLDDLRKALHVLDLSEYDELLNDCAEKIEETLSRKERMLLGRTS